MRHERCATAGMWQRWDYVQDRVSPGEDKLFKAKERSCSQPRSLQ